MLLVVAIDSVLTWVLWNKGLMEEGNPFMLWGLEKGPLAYWAIKLSQMMMVVMLITIANPEMKVFRYGYLAVMAVYSFVMLEFAVILIGLL